jgi:hypothetical protein
MSTLIGNCLLLLGVTLSFVSAAQGLEGMDAAANFSGAEGHMFRSFDNRYEGVRGFPTLLKDFADGSVELKNGATAKNVDLNLDIATGELLIKSQKTNKILVVQSKQVKSFVLTDESGRRMDFVNLDNLGFCEKIYEGQVRLYLKHTKYVEKANYSGAYNSNGRRYDEFVAEDKYYLFNGTSSPDEVKLTRKTIEKAFPEKSDEIRNYFKERKPDMKSHDEVAQLLLFLEGSKPVN